MACVCDAAESGSASHAAGLHWRADVGVHWPQPHNQYYRGLQNYHTILGVPFYSYSIMGSTTLIGDLILWYPYSIPYSNPYRPPLKEPYSNYWGPYIGPASKHSPKESDERRSPKP